MTHNQVSFFGSRLWPFEKDAGLKRNCCRSLASPVKAPKLVLESNIWASLSISQAFKHLCLTYVVRGIRVSTLDTESQSAFCASQIRDPERT